MFSSLIYAGLYGLKNNLENELIFNNIAEYSNEELCEEVRNNKYFSEKFGKMICQKLEEKLIG